MQNLNSVCYVAKINEIKPIEGATNIEQAVIGGWNSVVQIGKHKAGELVIIATTDAVIPDKLADELDIKNYLRKGNRVRTVKLRGVYSECLIISDRHISLPIEGEDMMPYYNVTKYEPPVKMISLGGPKGRKIRYHDNPKFHIYYKFPNLKNVPGMFNEQDTVEITRKIHGTNARYGIVKKSTLTLWDKVRIFFGNKWAEYDFVVGSHNVEKGSDSQGYYETNVWFDIEKKYNIKKVLWDYVKDHGTDVIGDGVILYGEIYGAGIQKGYDYGLKDIQFVGFDIKEDGEYLDVINTKLVIQDVMKLPYVKVLHYGNWSQEIQDKYVFNNFTHIDEEITVTDFTYNNMKGIVKTTKVPHEGIVIKHFTGKREKIAKVINPDYLIFAEKHSVGDSH
jgi:RNA ligase (TIGR02306 family)